MPRWLRKVGHVVAWPVDALGRRLGAQAVDGVLAHVNEAIAPPKEQPMVKNWQTSLGGVAAILTIVAKAVSGGDITATDIGVIIAGITALFAKDKSVTGAGATATRQP